MERLKTLHNLGEVSYKRLERELFKKGIMDVNGHCELFTICDGFQEITVIRLFITLWFMYWQILFVIIIIGLYLYRN